MAGSCSLPSAWPRTSRLLARPEVKNGQILDWLLIFFWKFANFSPALWEFVLVLGLRIKNGALYCHFINNISKNKMITRFKKILKINSGNYCKIIKKKSPIIFYKKIYKNTFVDFFYFHTYFFLTFSF